MALHYEIRDARYPSPPGWKLCQLLPGSGGEESKQLRGTGGEG